MNAPTLVMVDTHPVQYRAPLLVELNRSCGITAKAVYGSDFSVNGYRDREFGASFSWDIDLLSGYEARFLSRVKNGGASTVEEVSADQHAITATLKETHASAVLICGYSPAFHRSAYRAACALGLPILFRAETTDHGRTNRLKRVLRDIYLRRFYRGCDMLLYVGHHSRAHFLRLGCDESRLVFSPYCVDSRRFADAGGSQDARSAWRVEQGIGAAQVVVLFSGKLIPRKAPDLLLLAASRLPAEDRKAVVLVFAGSGPLEGQVRTLAERQGMPRTIFLGFRNQTELHEVYAAADLLVLPSRFETWGLVVNEALHRGIPVVASEQVGCAPDLIEEGETGELFEAGSKEGLTNALERGIRLARCTEAGRVCREKVEKYSLEHAAEGIAVALRKAVKS